jgi:hypothetical protein
MVDETSRLVEETLRVSTGMAVQVPPDSRISRSTVEMVEAGVLGSGGKGVVVVASEVDLAATMTTWC